MWDYFRNISDLPYLERKWPKANLEIKRKVSTYIKQAYEYQMVSRKATLLIQPVLTYYSLHNLTKAFLLLRGIDANTNYHGLCKCQPNEVFKLGSVETNEGVFAGLCGAFGHSFDKNEVLTIEDLLMNTIEGDQFLSDYFGGDNHYIKIQWHGTFDGHIKLDLINWKNIANDKDVLNAKINEQTTILQDFSLVAEGEGISLESLQKFDRADFNSQANTFADKYFFQNVYDSFPCWIKLVPTQKSYSPVIAYYALLYILSSYSRYNPDWMNRNVRSVETGSEYLISQIIHNAERIVPNYFINLIQGLNSVYK